MARKAKPKTAPSAPEAPDTQQLELMKQKAVGAGEALTIYGANPTELVMPDTMAEEDYLAFGVNIGRAMEFASWRIGDYVNFGKAKYGYKDYTKIAGVTGLSEEYLRQCASVSGRVAPHLRGVTTQERARLMLQRINKNETVDHLFKRLANKTTKEIRAMSRVGGGGGGGGGNSGPTLAGEVYTAAIELAKTLESFDFNERGAMLGALEAHKETGGQLRAVMNSLDAALKLLDERGLLSAPKSEAS